MSVYVLHPPKTTTFILITVFTVVMNFNKAQDPCRGRSCGPASPLWALRPGPCGHSATQVWSIHVRVDGAGEVDAPNLSCAATSQCGEPSPRRMGKVSLLWRECGATPSFPDHDLSLTMDFFFPYPSTIELTKYLHGKVVALITVQPPPFSIRRCSLQSPGLATSQVCCDYPHCVTK